MEFPHLRHREEAAPPKVDPVAVATEEAKLLEEFRKKQAEERARVPGMCIFILGNSMGCRKMAVQGDVYCLRHQTISQMITAGTITASDLAAELIQPPF